MLSGVRLSCYQEYENAGKPITARVCGPSNFLNKKYITFIISAPFRWTTEKRHGEQRFARQASPAFQQGGPRDDPRSAQPERRCRQDHARHAHRGRTGDARPACRPARCRPAGFIPGLDAAQKPARLATAVQRRGPRTRNAASGSARNPPSWADHVIIDGPPRIAALARSALLAAERVLIPVQPSPYDLWASSEMVSLIREAQVFRPLLLRGLRHQPARQHHHHRARGAAIARRTAAARAALGGASAHRLRRQRGRWPARTRDSARQCRRPRNHRPGGRTAAVADMTAQQPPNSKRTGKRVGIGARPPANPHAEAWIRQGDADALGEGDLYTARLTLDITPAMRARIKVSAFTQGVTVADLLRGLLEREFPPENTP